jgi:hypothetical protein
VIASAVIPTLIANMAFLPRHLLPEPAVAPEGGTPEARALRVPREEDLSEE